MAFLLNPFRPGLDTVRNRMLWGSFWDTSIQAPAVINTPQAVTFNTTDANSQGVSIVSGSRVTFSRTGVFSVTYSIQFTNQNSQIQDVNVWLRKNNQGSTGDLVDTNSRYSITESHGGVDGHIIGTVNYVYKLEADDYLELIWASPSLDVKLETLPATTVAPVHPRTPAIILTAVQVA